MLPNGPTYPEYDLSGVFYLKLNKKKKVYSMEKSIEKLGSIYEYQIDPK